MCSEADQSEVALRDAELSFTKTLQSSFASTFANQQKILSQLSGQLYQDILKPAGFGAPTLAAMRTGAIDTAAVTTANAQKAAAAYSASHGGADLGSGVQSQIQGDIATGGAQQLSQNQNQITVANAQQQQQNYWNAIGGLTQVGAAYNPTGYANASTGAAGATTAASNAISAEEQQGWQNAFGLVSGVAGLGTAAAGAYNVLENPAPAHA